MRSASTRSRLWGAIVALGLAALVPSASARQEHIATAGAANTRSVSTPPGGGLRVIEIGAEIIQNEKIETSATGSVQLLFIDKTTLSIGPNTSLVIDKFVFDPSTAQGSVSLDVTTGVLRVVGGLATHSGGATVTTPFATIGIRGGIATISHSKAKGTEAILGYGILTMTSRCGAGAPASCTPQTVTVTRPGFMVQAGAAGSPPGAPTRATIGDVAVSNSMLTSQGAQTGGSSVRPTDALVNSYNVGAPPAAVAPISASQNTSRGSNLTAIAIATATQQTVQQGVQSAGASTTATAVVTAAQAAAQAAAQLAPTPSPTPAPAVALAPIPTPTPTGPLTTPTPTPTVALTPTSTPTPTPTPTVALTPTPTPTPTPVVTYTPTPTAAYAILTTGPYSTSTGASPVPYLTASFAGQGNFTVSPILGFHAGGLNPDGTPDVTSRQFQAGLSVTGQGASQTSTIFVMSSILDSSPNIGFSQKGGFYGLNHQGSTGTWSYVGGPVSSPTPTSPPNSVPVDANGLPIAGYTLYNNNTNGNTGVVTNGTSNDSYDLNYTFNPITTAAPTTQTINHPNLTLQGYAGGLLSSAYINPINSEDHGQYSNAYIVTNVSGTPGDVTIYLPGSSSRMGAVFNLASVNPPANGLTTASYPFGSYSPSDPNNNQGRDDARGAYVNPSNFGGRSSTIFNNGANTPLTSRNGVVLSGAGDFAEGFLVTANTVGANTTAFLSSISSAAVTPCACEYTQWGFWGSLIGQSLDNGVSRYVDGGPIPMLWVAGVPTTAANLPTTGTASYTGHAIADISNNGALYLAAGSFANTVNFGTRTGAVTIAGLDGANYAGNVTLTPSSTLFAGNLAGTVAGRAISLNGSFFQGGATNTTPLYGEMGGNLAISGPGYIGTGIFAARKP